MISVVIPNFNGLSHLKDCFNSLRNQSCRDFKIYLVDNNSSDSSIEFTENNYPEVTVIRLDKNYGFSKAVNKGISEALLSDNPEYVVLLNNDIECHPEFLQELMNGFVSGDIGSVACKMLNYFDRTVIDDTGNFVKEEKFPYSRGQGEKDSGQYDSAQYIFGACAGAVMYRSNVFNKIGFFDEDYITYFEDLDFCFRLQYQNLKCYYNPNAVCFHKRGATGLSNIAYHRYLIERNILILRFKNYPFKVLRKYFFYYPYSGYIRIIRDAFWYSPKTMIYSFIGNIMGNLQLFKSLKKRRKIMKHKINDQQYIIDIWNKS